MKYAVITFGCRVNQADSLRIESELRARGGCAVRADDADVVIVNTCSVTASADQGARQTIRRVTRDNPDVKVIVTGCYATRRPDEIAALPNVMRVVTNPHKDTLVDDLAADLCVTTAQRFGAGDDACGAPLAPGVGGRTALTVRVQTGCDEHCSYCIIPQTRGRSRSRPMRDLIRDLEQATAAGYKEIAVTGVHLGSYGRDLADGSSLEHLMRSLAGWPGDVLFRISSLEPMDCSPAIVDLVAASPRLAPHFHLPLQHGSDDMLSAMRRPYTAAYYASLVTRIHRLMPHASIGSDVIVGFPGERDDHFAEMRRLLADLPLSHLHVFPYSDRPGTDATRMSAKVDGAVVRERGRLIRRVGEELACRFRRAQSGSIRRALTVDDGCSAVTDNYLKIRLDRRHARNEWIEVPIEADDEGHLKAAPAGEAIADPR
jgi:threonylcarbamoyladenosine tRNA methylthiotransferase MtaB